MSLGSRGNENITHTAKKKNITNRGIDRRTDEPIDIAVIESHACHSKFDVDGHVEAKMRPRTRLSCLSQIFLVSVISRLGYAILSAAVSVDL